MSSRKFLLIMVLCLFFISNTSSAVMCARLKSVSGGEDHTLALADDNTLWACGGRWDNYKQLGLGSGVYNVQSLTQVKGENGVGFLKNIATYDAGWEHSLAADVNETIWSWGYDNYGQLGNGPGNDPCYFPTKVHGPNNVGYLSHIVYVSAGRSGEHSLAIDANGYVYAWGYNYYGQCGDGNTGGQRNYPVLVLDSNSQTTDGYLGDETHVIAVDAGKFHSLALDADGYVWHWGKDGSISRAYPKKVKASNDFGGEVLSNIVQISSCGHSVAVDSNGNVWEWSDSNNAYKVPGGEMGTTYLENIVEVGAGYGHSMARTSDGYVLVWFTGFSPQYVEDGKMETLSGLLEGIVSIGSGYYDHQLAISEGGYGWAWGNDNTCGQFGVGNLDPHPEPTQMLCAEVPISIRLTKTSEIQGSDPNCAYPGDEITYTITYDANGHSDTNVMIIDYLPVDVTYDYIDPNTGEQDQNYNPADHTYTWNIGAVSPGDYNTFTLTVQVNASVEPGMVITNRCEMVGDLTYNSAETKTPVCCWNPGVIYVDRDRVAGRNTGMSWEDAYVNLQKALTRAGNGCGSSIWVAEGNYLPCVPRDQPTFQLINGVPVYGHFAGNETSLSQRDLNDPDNETILSGVGVPAHYVVTASGLDQNTILDGFTITGASSYIGAVRIEKANLTVKNCLIIGNDIVGSYGIYANESGFTVAGCTIQDNTSRGIYADFNNNNTLPETRIENSIIRNNGTAGIFLYRVNSPVVIANSRIHNNSSLGIDIEKSFLPPVVTGCRIFANGSGIYDNNAPATIINNWIYKNGVYGIYFAIPKSVTIRNNTIVGSSRGIYLPSGTAPTITSCIIWGNSTQLSGCDATYSCIQNYSGSGTGNIKTDPCFTYLLDSNDFHLKPNSLCIDVGDPCFTDSSDKDIDGEPRISFGKTATQVDMGADELYRPKADFNHDDIVNFIDFAMFATSWATSLGEQDYNDLYDLEDDNVIDIYDLAQFCDDWLWIAPWSPLYESLGIGGMDMVIEGGTSESLALAEDTSAEVVADEQIESIGQPMSDEQIQALIDWTEQLWQSDPNIREMVNQADYNRILDSLKEQLNE
jgi:uncharacterized repeat protein (TIGR01451 family)